MEQNEYGGPISKNVSPNKEDIYKIGSNKQQLKPDPNGKDAN